MTAPVPEVRTEWAVRYPNSEVSEPLAENFARSAYEAHGLPLLSRTVTVGPWEQVTG